MPQLSQHSLHTKRKNPGNSFQIQSNCSTVRRRGAALHSHSSTVRCRAGPNSNATARPPAAEGQQSFSNSIVHRSPPRGSSPISPLHRLLPRGSATASGQPEGADPGPSGPRPVGPGPLLNTSLSFSTPGPRKRWREELPPLAIYPRTRGSDNAHQHLFCRGWALDVSEIQIVCPLPVA